MPDTEKELWRIPFLVLWLLVAIGSYSALGILGVVFCYLFMGFLLAVCCDGYWRLIVLWLPTLVSRKLRDKLTP